MLTEHAGFDSQAWPPTCAHACLNTRMHSHTHMHTGIVQIARMCANKSLHSESSQTADFHMELRAAGVSEAVGGDSLTEG